MGMNVSKEDVFNIVLHVMIMTVAIAFFYFAYVPSVELRVVNKSVDSVMQSIADDVHDAVPKSTLDAISPIADQYLKDRDMTKEDADARKHNEEVRASAVKFVAIVVGVCLAVLAYVGWTGRNEIPFREVFMENAIVVSATMLVYFLFVTFVAQNYETADPNVVKKTIVSSLKKFVEG